MRSLLGIVVLALASAAVYAGGVPPGTAPEPGTFELLALGGVMAIVVAIRNRRKK
jgi:peptidoglycan/LPS O-acetylase OafA/YrhL